MRGNMILIRFKLWYFLSLCLLITLSCRNNGNQGTTHLSEKTPILVQETATISQPTVSDAQLVEADINSEILENLDTGLYLLYNNNEMIYAASLENGSTTLLTVFPMSHDRFSTFVFSANGELFGYYRERKLTVVNIAVKETVHYDLDEECIDIALTSSGEWIACYDESIFLYSLKTKQKLWITPHDSELNLQAQWIDPRFSVDDQQIAYRRATLAYAPGINEGIYVSNWKCYLPDSICEDEILGPYMDSTVFSGTFALSPDEWSLVIPAGKSIYLFDTLTKSTSLLVEEHFGDEIAWSPDGKYIAFSDEGVYLLPLDDGGLTKISNHGWEIGWIKIP
jgi:hypothetical protein